MFENLKIEILKIIVNTFGGLSDGISLAQKEGFTSGKMLDYIYKNEAHGRMFIGKILDSIYINHPGWQDVRQRKNNLVSNLKDAVNLTLIDKGEVRICDVASGPARYIIETLEGFKNKNVSAEIRDLDSRWLEDASKLAFEKGVKVDYRVANALKKEDFIFEKRADIMVASGFYDWFDDIDILKTSMELIHDALPQNGYFVFSVQSGHYALNLTNKIFKDFNNHQLKMVTWDMKVINSLLDKTGFEVIKVRMDENGHYPVLLTKKI